MFDQETCVLLQGCQRQGLYISNYFPWSLAVIVSVHWFVAISFNIYFSKCAHNTVQILGKHFHIVQDSDSKYGKHVTIVSWQFDSISISDFEYYQNLSVCVSSFFFVRFITSLVWFSWSRTALWWSSASQNTMLSESVDVVMLIMKLGRRPLFCSNVAKARLHTSMSDRQRITCKALMQVLHFFAVLPSLQVCSLFWFLMCRCQCEKWLMLPDHYSIIAYKMTCDGKKHCHDMLQQWYLKKPCHILKFHFFGYMFAWSMFYSSCNNQCHAPVICFLDGIG